MRQEKETQMIVLEEDGRVEHVTGRSVGTKRRLVLTAQKDV